MPQFCLPVSLSANSVASCPVPVPTRAGLPRHGHLPLASAQSLPRGTSEGLSVGSPPHLPASPHTFVSAHVLPSLPARFPASCASWACPGRCSSLGLCEVLPGGPPPGMTHSLGVCQHMLSSPRPGCSSQRPGPRLSYLCPGAPRTGAHSRCVMKMSECRVSLALYQEGN